METCSGIRTTTCHTESPSWAWSNSLLPFLFVPEINKHGGVADETVAVLILKRQFGMLYCKNNPSLIEDFDHFVTMYEAGTRIANNIGSNLSLLRSTVITSHYHRSIGKNCLRMGIEPKIHTTHPRLQAQVSGNETF